MANQQVLSVVEAAYDQSIDPPDEEAGGFGVVSVLAQAGELAPAWWSRSRDVYLSNFWKRSNHLSLALYNAQSKLAGIPFLIEARDPTVTKHVDRAEEISLSLKIASEFGEGIEAALERFYEDLLTQDNGAFLEIIQSGDEPRSGPIMSTPFAVRHLDSQMCTRTGNAEYPVLYQRTGGDLFKLHWTRVIYMSQMTSARYSRNGVGFSAISRAIDIAQTAVDVIRYKQERLGSRPPNQLLLGKGIPGKSIMKAIRMAGAQMDNEGLARYARTVAIGSEEPDVDLVPITLNHLDPFDEKVSIQYAMFGIAAAFGLDVTEIWPVAGAGGSEAGAKMQNMRARGKLPAQVTAQMAQQFNFKFLPPYLEMKFDFRDDEEDQQRAVISDIRGRRRERDIGSGVLNVSAARRVMLQDGDITRSMFSEMERASGRLEDGTPVYSLFFEPEGSPYRDFLDLGTAAPLDFEHVNFDEMMVRIAMLKEDAARASRETRAKGRMEVIKNSLAAIEWYEDELMRRRTQMLPERHPEPISGTPVAADDSQGRVNIQVEEEVDEEEAEGSGRSSMGRTRQPGTEKSILEKVRERIAWQ